MHPTETYQVWLVIKGRSAWDGRKFSFGVYDGRLFGLKHEAENVAARYGADVKPFTITSAVDAIRATDPEALDFGEPLEAGIPPTSQWD